MITRMPHPHGSAHSVPKMQASHSLRIGGQQEDLPDAAFLP